MGSTQTAPSQDELLENLVTENGATGNAAESNVASAMREDAVIPAASRAERFSSYDVEAFEVPGGREENWRFTPMKRLRGLHQGIAASGKVSVEADVAPEVRVE